MQNQGQGEIELELDVTETQRSLCNSSDRNEYQLKEELMKSQYVSLPKVKGKKLKKNKGGKKSKIQLNRQDIITYSPNNNIPTATPFRSMVSTLLDGNNRNFTKSTTIHKVVDYLPVLNRQSP